MINLFCILFTMLFTVVDVTEANRLYYEGRYSESLMQYENLLEKDPQSAALHYNAGNACFRMRLYGRAIFHYRQSLSLSPRDEDARNNLKLAESSLSRPAPSLGPFSFSKFFRELPAYVPLNVTVIILLIFWYAVMIFALIRLIRPDYAKKTLFPLILAGSLFLLSSVFIIGNRLAINNYKEAVILKPVTEARTEPGISGTVLFEVYEGWSAEIQAEEPEWLRIRLDSGNEGWIRRDDAGVVNYD